MSIKEFVHSHLVSFANKLSEAPVPIMSQEAYEKLPYYKKCMLTCNVPGCGEMVCTHGMLCLDHHLGLKFIEQLPKEKS